MVDRLDPVSSRRWGFFMKKQPDAKISLNRGHDGRVKPKLLQFFTVHYRPGIIGIIGTRGTIGMAIREAQKTMTSDGKTSLWSHCFIFGDLRLDRRGEGGERSRSPYIFESDLHADLFKSQLRNGPRRIGLVNIAGNK